MSYNGYGMDNDFGAYAGQHAPSYMDGAYGAYGEPTLQQGSKGSSVTQLQNLLIAAGYETTLAPYGADGDYGPRTATAVRAFQASKGLSATGIADQATWNALRSAGTSSGAAPIIQGTGEDGRVTARDIVGGLSNIFQPSGNASAPQAPNWLANIFGGSPAGSPPPATTPVVQESKTPTWVLVTGSVVGVALVGGLIFALTRKKK